MFTLEQLEQIEEGALRILEETGVNLQDPDVSARIFAKGFKRNAAGRVIIERAVVKAFIKEERDRNGNNFRKGPQAMEPQEEFTAFVSPYPLSFHDIATDEIVPFTAERLTWAVKLCDAAASRGLVSSPPGTPSDVPAPLQPILSYWIAATYSRQGKHPVDARWEESMPYVMDMADALGEPIRNLPIYVFSPLNLSGESFHCVLKYKDRLKGFSVGSMPAPGSTAPLNLGDAFALSAAENIGPAIIMREIINLPVGWHVPIFPVDMRSIAMIFGSPENLIFHLLSSEVTAYFKGTQWYPAANNTHSIAKLPGAQSCVEKSSIMTAGALLGERWFGAIGTLSLEEVFSPEQLVYDLEMMDHVKKMVSPFDVTCDPARAAADTAEGVKAGSFLELDSTAESYKEVYWSPPLFEREYVEAWKKKGGRKLRDRAHEMIRDMVARHEYRLEPHLQKAIDGILEKAKKAFPG